MKSCKGCKHADWKRRADGKLHPDGYGFCGCEVRLPPLPVAKHWISRPIYTVGTINRHQELPAHCVYWIMA